MNSLSGTGILKSYSGKLEPDFQFCSGHNRSALLIESFLEYQMFTVIIIMNNHFKDCQENELAVSVCI